jgi:hypothetical protein
MNGSMLMMSRSRRKIKAPRGFSSRGDESAGELLREGDD